LEILSKVDSENYIILGMHISNYKESSFINSSLQCCNESEDCEEVVVERIAMKHQKTSEDQETSKDDTTEHEGVRVQILVPIC
jgi:hypothetical protein